MSYFAFHFPDESEVRIKGSERASFGLMIEDHAKGAIGVTHGMGRKSVDTGLRPFVNPDGPLGEFLKREPSYDGRLEQALSYVLHTMPFREGAAPFVWRGHDINTRQLLLNTVLATGSDAMRLAVKIHFQCELHGYLMGYHRKWFADVVQEGLDEHVYHRDLGWEDLVAKLRESNDGPVVSSASSTGSFPNPEMASWKGTEEGWDALGADKQWKQAVKGLKTPGRNRPWEPGNLRTYRFGHDLSLLDLVRGDIERIEKGLKIT